MATIGTFKLGSNGVFTGNITTLTINAKLTIKPTEASGNASAPTHRVFIGTSEIGAVWEKTSKEGRMYHSIKIEDPSFTAPLYATLLKNEDDTCSLIWPQARKAA
jgi:uncharacterized protein (DUF736 family)